MDVPIPECTLASIHRTPSLEVPLLIHLINRQWSVCLRRRVAISRRRRRRGVIQPVHRRSRLAPILLVRADTRSDTAGTSRERASRGRLDQNRVVRTARNNELDEVDDVLTCIWADGASCSSPS